MYSCDDLYSCQSINDAYRICFEKSGLDFKEVAWQCGWRDSGKVLQQILYATAAMPYDRIIPFMAACGNAFPLYYLNLKTRDNTADITEIVQYVVNEVKEDNLLAMKGPTAGGTSFSLSGPIGIPDWLVAEVRALWPWKDE